MRLVAWYHVENATRLAVILSTLQRAHGSLQENGTEADRNEVSGGRSLRLGDDHGWNGPGQAAGEAKGVSSGQRTRSTNHETDTFRGIARWNYNANIDGVQENDKGGNRR